MASSLPPIVTLSDALDYLIQNPAARVNKPNLIKKTKIQPYYDHAKYLKAIEILNESVLQDRERNCITIDL